MAIDEAFFLCVYVGERDKEISSHFFRPTTQTRGLFFFTTMEKKLCPRCNKELKKCLLNEEMTALWICQDEDVSVIVGSCLIYIFHLC